jgi:hypothetical protein
MLGFRTTTGKFAGALEKLQVELDAIPGQLAERRALYDAARFDTDAADDADRPRAEAIAREHARTIRHLEQRQRDLPAEIAAAQSDAERKAADDDRKRREGDARAAAQHLSAMNSAIDDTADLLDRLTRVYRRFVEPAASFRQLTGQDMTPAVRRQIGTDIAAIMDGEAPTALRSYWREGVQDRKQAVADIKSPPPPAPPRPPLLRWPGVEHPLAADDRHKGRTYLEHLAAHNAAVQEQWTAARQRVLDRLEARVAAGTASPGARLFFDGKWYEVPDETARGLYDPDPLFVAWQRRMDEFSNTGAGHAGAIPAVRPADEPAPVFELPEAALMASEGDGVSQAPEADPEAEARARWLREVAERDEALLRPGPGHCTVDGKPYDEWRAEHPAEVNDE